MNTTLRQSALGALLTATACSISLPDPKMHAIPLVEPVQPAPLLIFDAFPFFKGDSTRFRLTGDDIVVDERSKSFSRKRGYEHRDSAYVRATEYRDGCLPVNDGTIRAMVLEGPVQGFIFSVDSAGYVKRINKGRIPGIAAPSCFLQDE